MDEYDFIYNFMFFTQEDLSPGLLLTTTFVPGGWSIIMLHSNSPLICMYAKLCKCNLECRMVLRLTFACWIIMSHSYILNFKSKINNLAMKWFLYFWMDLSIFSNLWCPIGKNWYSTSIFFIIFWSFVEVLFSMTWHQVLYLWTWRSVDNSFSAHIIYL